MQALHTASKAKGQSLPNTNSHEANLDCEIISIYYSACTCKGHSEVYIFTTGNEHKSYLYWFASYIETTSTVFPCFAI